MASLLDYILQQLQFPGKPMVGQHPLIGLIQQRMQQLQGAGYGKPVVRSSMDPTISMGGYGMPAPQPMPMPMPGPQPVAQDPYLSMGGQVTMPAPPPMPPPGYTDPYMSMAPSQQQPDTNYLTPVTSGQPKWSVGQGGNSYGGALQNYTGYVPPTPLGKWQVAPGQAAGMGNQPRYTAPARPTMNPGYDPNANPWPMYSSTLPGGSY